MLECPVKETKRLGRKPGTKNIPRPDKQTTSRHAHQLKARVLLTERGMANGSLVKFHIPQQTAVQLFSGRVDVEKTYKIGKMISVKNSHSGRLECTLHTMSGTLIGFVLVEYLNAENQDDENKE